SGTAPLAVRLDASASSDADGSIVSYRFDFGDGTSAGPQSSSVANHTYAAGSWTARVTVTDNQGAAATASASVTVSSTPANQAPVARLTASPSSGTAPLAVRLDASASSDADGSIVSYRFDFGDGTSAGPQSSSVANHTYAAGSWTARVTVTDNQGAAATASASVTVSSTPGNQAPVARLTASPSSGTAPLAVRLDASASSDADGSIVSYRFDFGDGTSAGPQSSSVANHTYAAGSWTARVTVTDNQGAAATASASVTVSSTPANQAPVARLTASPSSGTAPLAVRLDASASSDADGSIVSYRFDFGDGTSAGPQSSSVANHTYAAGSWTARVTVTDNQGAAATASASVTVSSTPANQAPVARLTASPSSGTAPLAVRLDASASSDADGSIVSYRFDFGDGTSAGPQSSSVANHTYAAGSWTARVTVTDNQGAAATASASVTVSSTPANQAPVARLTASPSSGTAPLAVRLDASASSDADGSIVSYRFDFGDGTSAGPQSSSVANHTYAAGSWTARVTVTDNQGAAATASASVTVSSTPANQAPVARLTASPSSGTAPLAVRLDASASSDADGSIVSYRFDFGDGTSAGPQSSSVANHTYAAGSWTARVTVTDNQGAAATASASVTVSSTPANQAPVARLTASPSSGTAPLAVRLDASASSDADGSIVSYRFDFGDGTSAGPQSSSVANHTYAAGSWTARVTVTDNQGAAATASASVTVSSTPGNQAPVARLTASPSSGTAPLAVRLDASASSDADGSIVSYRFDFGDGTSAGPQSSSVANHTYAAGSWTARVTVTDNQGAAATASASVTVSSTPGNQAPVARLTASPSSGTAPLAVRLDASASSDADGSIVSYRFDFGDGTSAGPQSSSVANHTYAAGSWTARVTVTDNQGATATASASVTASPPANQAPVARLAASPSSGTAPLAVRLDASASSDADGSVASYRFEFGDGTSAGPQTSGAANHTYGAGNWTAKVTVTDNRGATSSALVSVSVSSPPSNLVANGTF